MFEPSCTYYNTNDLLDFATAAQLIQKDKRLANVVVVYMHAGPKGPTPTT